MVRVRLVQKENGSGSRKHCHQCRSKIWRCIGNPDSRRHNESLLRRLVAVVCGAAFDVAGPKAHEVRLAILCTGKEQYVDVLDVHGNIEGQVLVRLIVPARRSA